MKRVGVLLLILYLSSFHVEAQDDSNSDQSGALKPLQPSLTVVLGIISVMICLTFLVLAYAKYCHRNDTARLSYDNLQTFAPLPPRSRFSGIDREVIDSLPFFKFSSLKGLKDGLECAVCLSKFEDTEILRLLPKCNHCFHMNCIDKWLESHSSCPLCRYKFDAKELKSFSYSASLRYLQTPSNLTDDLNLELFIQREEDRQASSRFNFRRGKKEEFLIQDKFLHKLKHKIIVSDIIIKNRWSDVNSSDLLSLSSEMLNIMSSNRFSRSGSNSGRLCSSMFMNEHVEKIKDDIERKKLYESKNIGADRSSSFSASCFPSTSYKDECAAKIVNSSEKRSMSEITICSRFKDLNVKNKSKESASPRSSRSEKEDRTRRLWLSIARKTVQWFAGRQEQDYGGQTSNV